MSPDPLVYLEHMLDAARRVSEYVEGMDFESFLDSGMVQDAVLRNLEIIGEAAKHVPDDLREKAPEIDWRAVCGFRDVIAHDYDTVDLDVVWDAVENEIPGLRDSLGGLLEELSGADS